MGIVKAIANMGEGEGAATALAKADSWRGVLAEVAEVGDPLERTAARLLLERVSDAAPRAADQIITLEGEFAAPGAPEGARVVKHRGGVARVPGCALCDLEQDLGARSAGGSGRG